MNAMKLAIPLFVALAYGPSQGLAAPILGSELSSFAVLGASDVTSANISTFGGNVGSYPTAPTSAVTNYTFSFGTLQPGTEALAQDQLTAARSALGTGTGGLTSLSGSFAPGTYDFGAGLLGAGETLTLNGGGSNTAVWIFRFTSTLTTDQTSIFSMIDVGNGAGVGLYWNVGSSATLDGDTFAGNVLALTSITTNGNLTMGCGRLLADNGKVGLEGVGSNISTGCGVAGNIGFGSGGFDQAGVAAIPEPETYAMMLAGLGLLGFMARRRKQKAAA